MSTNKGIAEFANYATKEQYINSRYEKVKELNLNIDNYINNLNNIIKDIKNKNLITIDEFIKKDIEEFNIPKDLLVKNKAPIKKKIRKPNIREKLFEIYKLKYDAYVRKESDKYNRKYALYEQKEIKRKQEISSLKSMYELQTNEIINTKKVSYLNGDTFIIAEYNKYLLIHSKYPFNFNKKIKVGYLKDSKSLVIDYLLPNISIIPYKKYYEYRPRKDEIKEKLRKDKERKHIYNETLFSIVLKSIDEIFRYDAGNVIDYIIFNGYIKDIDLSTGQEINPYIISILISKTEFNNIDISKVDKLTCLKERMHARISIKNSNDLNPIIPIYEYDYK